MESSAVSTLRAFRPVIVTLLFYLAVSQLAHTLLYTIVTYMVSLSAKTGPEFSNTVNEISGQYLLLSLALGALLLTVTIWQADRALYRQVPFWNELHRPVWQLDRVRKEELLRGVSNGTLAALVYLIFFTLAGQISYLGVYITSTIGTAIFPFFFMDLIALATLLVCEEFLFRHKILRNLQTQMGATSAVLLTAALHIFVRHWQVQLETLDYFNLACLNLTLGYFYVKNGKCQRGLGFIWALLSMLHNFGGLPLWGLESPSVFLFKATPRASTLLNGGASGPLGGAAILGILMLFMLGAYLTWKRELEARRQALRR